MELTDKQWQLIEPLIPRPPPAHGGRPTRDLRQVLNGIIWVLRTGAQWRELPQQYGPFQTCHRWFSRWVLLGVFEDLARLLAEDLHASGQLELAECFIDGSFAAAKKGASKSAKPSAARAPKSWPSPKVMVCR